MSQEELYNHAQSLLNIYATFQKCYILRTEYMEKFIKPEDRDEGHIFQVAKIKGDMDTYLSLLIDTFSRIESFPYDEPQDCNDLEDADSSDKSSNRITLTTIKEDKKQYTNTCKTLNQQLRETGIDVDLISKQLVQQENAYDIYDQIIYDVSRSNMKRLLRRAYKNPYIWQIAMPHAFKINNLKVIHSAFPHIQYLRSQGCKHLEQIYIEAVKILIINGKEKFNEHISHPPITIPDKIGNIVVQEYVKPILTNGTIKAKIDILHTIVDYIAINYPYIRNPQLIDFIIYVNQTALNVSAEVSQSNEYKQLASEIGDLWNYLLTAAAIYGAGKMFNKTIDKIDELCGSFGHLPSSLVSTHKEKVQRIKKMCQEEDRDALLNHLLSTYMLKVQKTDYVSTLTNDQIEEELSCLEKIPSICTNRSKEYYDELERRFIPNVKVHFLLEIRKRKAH